MVILSILGLGLLTISYGVRYNSTKIQNEAIAMLAAEAGYETAVFWMEQQNDMVSYIQASGAYTGSLTFPNSTCDYTVSLYSFSGSRPVYRVTSNGHCGKFSRTDDVLVIQAVSGWDMGMCQVPNGTSSTGPVYFTDGEVIDMPIHINKADDSPDNMDIFVSGDPQFLETVSMGEDRYRSSGGVDKYAGQIGVFDAGIDFDQPDSKITDTAAVQSKVDRFKNSTKGSYTFTPGHPASLTTPEGAVQLEFFVQGGVGKVRITNNCTVRGYPAGSRDYELKPGTTDQYRQYNIYAYHYSPTNADATGQRTTQTIASTYVTQTIGGVTSDPGGQIFVNGDVIIGGNDTVGGNAQVVNGKITVVATGNIWVADSIVLDGDHDADGMPSKSNTNALGLISQGVIKVVDPGIPSSLGNSERNQLKNSPDYAPIGIPDPFGHSPANYSRYLPEQMVVEAAMTVGGGGWGAENVGSRREYSSPQDDLIVRGTITEVIRGVVGTVGTDGFLKHYYFDRRFLEGILPGDIWLQGKYIPAPAGWNDYETIH
jgi:hypothetical protein